jgi:3-oxoacyl-[acyl-carrier protein] reductase
MIRAMDFGISGRTAVVTGATRGIGAAAARLLRDEGARVVPVARSEGIDVTARDAAERIAERAGGPVDILVNNAGTSTIRPLEEMLDEDYYDAFELNVMAPMRLMRRFAPAMAERGWGRIVNVTSSAGKRPSQTWPAYSVAKAAQHSLSRLFADYWAASGVLINVVAPGPTATSLWMDPGGLADQVAEREGIARDEAIARQAAKSPLGRFADEEEVAAVVAFLCSERAGNVAGAAWSADGGAFQSMI